MVTSNLLLISHSASKSKIGTDMFTRPHLTLNILWPVARKTMTRLPVPANSLLPLGDFSLLVNRSL